MSIFKRTKLDHPPHVMFKITSRWIIELNVGTKTEFDNCFLNMTPKAKAIREKLM